jgi:hypothetical protein
VATDDVVRFVVDLGRDEHVVTTVGDVERRQDVS